MSSIINKVKDAISGNEHHTTTTTTTTSSHHPAGGVGGGVGGNHNTAGTTGTTGGLGGNQGTAEGVHGPHSSRLANAADPRVDSDRDGRIGANTNVAPGTHSAGAGAYGADHHHSGTTGTTHAGNHIGGAGDRGGLSNSTNAGPHNSNLANKADPRVDSDLDHRGNRHGASHGGILGASGSHATAGSGTAQNTNGPHNSDTLNKLDPRVDADGDGSRTIGGNRTHATSSGQKDPTNAAHVTPSVLAQHIGQPTVLHDDPNAKHAERHGSLSHQETHI